jgi:ubiquinone/menaquinone biosynthesis C-methylase UbiE
MPDQFTIYQNHADQYEQLTTHEDYEHRLYPALAAIRSFDRADIVEWGAGTGRVSALVAPYARSLIACDLNAPMLHVAAGKLRRSERLQWCTLAADHRHMPLPDRCADIALSGWALGYLTAKYYADWKSQLARVIAQMRRVLRPGGTIIIIETLGTGMSEPQPPTPYLSDYYRLLEEEHGFHATWVRTDFKFDSLEQAASTISFFFGDEWDVRVRRNNWIVLPECTGIWWKEVW